MHIGEKVIARGVNWEGNDFSMPARIVAAHEDHNGKKVCFETTDTVPSQGTWVKQRLDGSWRTDDYNSPYFVELVPLPLSVRLITQLAEE
jgi:hypothetical protein